MLYTRYYPHLAARHVAKFYEPTPFDSKDPSSNSYSLWQFLLFFEKSCKGAPVPGGECASKNWSFCSACTNLGAQHFLGAEIWPSEKFDLSG